MPSPRAAPHATELANLKRRVLCGSSIAFASMMGFQTAIGLYSGPSIALGLLLSIGTAVALSLALVCLPESARVALAHLVSFLL